MPSNWIVNLDCNYPTGPYDLSELEKAILNRYYLSFFARVESAGFPFPPEDRYLRQFGVTLLASFIYSAQIGFTFNPGNDQRWLVYVHIDSGLVLLIVRYVVVVDGHMQLFGERGHSVQCKANEECTINGVAVPSDTVERLLWAV